jgi:hypothetical protein
VVAKLFATASTGKPSCSSRLAACERAINSQKAPPDSRQRESVGDVGGKRELEQDSHSVVASKEHRRREREQAGRRAGRQAGRWMMEGWREERKEGRKDRY